MKVFLNILGVLLVLVGLIWILQGINMLAGSPMTGQRVWALNGGISILIGAGLLAFANLRGRNAG